ncbi:MAG: hypothetical protein ABW224_13335 [Kibdelosporangium sp.]
MLEEREETRYDVRAFAKAYVDAQPDGESGFMPGHASYSAAMKVHHQQILAGLQDLFEFAPDSPERSTGQLAFLGLFRDLVASYHRIMQPVTRHAETGPLTRQLEDAGQREMYSAGMARIDQARQLSAEAHLDVMAGLLANLLDGQAAKVFTSADLRAIGIDDTPPDPDDPLHDAWENY